MTYIFDLYGTLIDIWTDEASMNLWRPLAAFYASCGADYTPEALRDAYLRTVAEEEAKLRLRTGLTFPEITLEPVFLRLLDECPKKHPIALPLNRAAWVIDTATWFRVLSRKRLRAYPEAAPTLRELRRRGHRILLLSNAQRVFTLPELELTGLDGLLDGVYISSEAGMRKPEPAFLERLLKAEGLAPRDCVLVGNDLSTDMAVAAACGVKGIFLNTDGLTEKEIAHGFQSLMADYNADLEAIPSGSLALLLTK